MDDEVVYDEAADALYVRLRSGNVAKTVSVDDHRLVDIDAAGAILGVEFLDASGGLDLALPDYRAETANLHRLLRDYPFKILV